MAIKAVFFDIDNTLLSHTQHRIPESAVKALQELGEKGIHRVLATGRHILQMETLPDVLDHEYEGYVLLEGQLCLNGQREKLSSFPIDGKALEEVLELFESRDISVFLFEPDRIYVNYYDDRAQELLKKDTAVLPPVAAYEGGEVLMASIFATPEEEEALAPRLGSCNRFRWNNAGLDIIGSTGGKVGGIRQYLENLNILPEETMAFGDGENDIEMLQMAGIGVAMGNAPDNVKASADYVTDDIDEDGIYNALKHFGVL